MADADVLSWAVARADGPIVRKIQGLAQSEALPAKEHRRASAGEPLRFHVDALAEPVSRQGKRAFIGTPMSGWSPFEIYCSEGTPLGGEDDAPSPLGYLTSAVAFCLLTHITAFLGPSRLKIDRIKVEVRGNYAAAPDHSGGGAESFETRVLIDSPETSDAIQAFVERCERACIAMQTIANPTPTSTRVVHNGTQI